MKLIKLSLLEPRDCFGKKPDGKKTLIKEATRDVPALFVTSQLEAYRSLMIVDISGIEHTLEVFATPTMVHQVSAEQAALYILRELCAKALEISQSDFNQQVNNYLKEHPHA